MLKMIFKKIATLLFSIFLFSCASNIDKTQGSALQNYSKESLVKNIKADVTDKRDVLMMLGIPLNNPNYNKSPNWEYYSKVIDRNIWFFVPIFRDKEQFLSINFSETGLVKDYNYIEKN